MSPALLPIAKAVLMACGVVLTLVVAVLSAIALFVLPAMILQSWWGSVIGVFIMLGVAGIVMLENKR